MTAETDLRARRLLGAGPAASCRRASSRPTRLGQETRGKGTNTRYVTNILPEDEPADCLLVVEVITPGGHSRAIRRTSTTRTICRPRSYLEETYYHRLNPPQGFAFQRVYTDDRSLDEAMAIEDGDVVLVPKGYHPCAAAHGYDLYYLNVMAGPKRTWKFHNAPEHEWLMRAEASRRLRRVRSAGKCAPPSTFSSQGRPRSTQTGHLSRPRSRYRSDHSRPGAF